MRYRLLDHTSDIRVEVRGRDLSELFSNAAFCLFDIMLNVSEVKPAEQRTVELQSPDLSELFLDWLRELLFFFSTRSFAVSRADACIRLAHLDCGGEGSALQSLSAVLSGQPYDPARHGLKVEIKTPTYHEYNLEETSDGWRATLILDV